MDDLAHDFPLNHRKRKADSDDPQQPPQPQPIVTTDPSQPEEGFSNAPRQPWIATDSGDSLWSPQVSSPLSTEVVHSTYDTSTKRPRIDKNYPRSPGKRSVKKMPAPAAKIIPKLQASRHGSDLEDIGIISTADPGPSSGSLLRARSSFSNKHADHLPRLSPVCSVDFSSPHFPSLQPLINRQTLKELDLDAIMRNPQLRHDLLFDPGLQFRPTCSRRKRDLSERYWAAVTHEVETGCTCVSFDALGKPHPTVCICAHAPRATTSPPPVYPATSNAFTVRMQSRIRGLLTEFLEVLLLVIQPLSTISGIYVNAAKFKAQMEEHSAQAAFLRSVFDPTLIEQELEHNLFDPSGLFRTIGITLKKHCAPMRDSAVETMVHAALSCAPGGPGTKEDAVKAVRMCMEILELMKLDIANHQLQALRPFLIRTAGQFELKTLRNRSGGEGSLHLTREWIHNAHGCLASRTQPLTLPHCPDQLNFNSLSRNQQIYLSVLKGTVDLVFNPPPAISSPSTPASPTSPLTPNCPLSFSAFPETFHLDTSRLLHFNSDATDVTAMYMFLLLYRQLVNSDSLEQDRLKVSDGELTRLKREIRDIANTKLGVCFSASSLNSAAADAADVKMGSEMEKWMEIKQSIVLQIAKRAKDARCQSQTHSTLSSPSSLVGEAPDERLLNIAQKWADSTMQPGSSLSVMLHDRLRDTVFNAVVGLTYPGSNGSAPSVLSLPSSKSEFSSSLLLNLASGMEPLADEIRSLSEKISRLAIIHLNAYLPLYEKDGFLQP